MLAGEAWPCGVVRILSCAECFGCVLLWLVAVKDISNNELRDDTTDALLKVANCNINAISRFSASFVGATTR